MESKDTLGNQVIDQLIDLTKSDSNESSNEGFFESEIIESPELIKIGNNDIGNDCNDVVDKDVKGRSVESIEKEIDRCYNSQRNVSRSSVREPKQKSQSPKTVSNIIDRSNVNTNKYANTRCWICNRLGHISFFCKSRMKYSINTNNNNRNYQTSVRTRPAICNDCNGTGIIFKERSLNRQSAHFQ